jgi:hypothetical protein
MNLDFEDKTTDSSYKMPKVDAETFAQIPSFSWDYDLFDDGWVWRPPRFASAERFEGVLAILVAGGFGLSMLYVLVSELVKIVFEPSQDSTVHVIVAVGLVIPALLPLLVAFRFVKQLLNPFVTELFMDSKARQIRLGGLKRFWLFQPLTFLDIPIPNISSIKVRKYFGFTDDFALWLELENKKRVYLGVYNMQKQEALFLQTVLERELEKFQEIL